MPRKRTGDIRETLQQLEQLETTSLGKPQYLRIKVIRLMKQRPGLRMQDIADMIGVSEKTVKRWWNTYRVGGLSALRKMSAGARSVADVDDQLVILKQKLISGDFANVEEVREWLGTSDPNPTPVDFVGARGRALDPVAVSHFVAFMNRLPTTFAIDEWTVRFRDALHTFLGEIDRVMVGVNSGVDLLRPESYQVETTVTRGIASESEVLSVNEGSNTAPLERQLDILRRANFPFAEYHPPSCYTYYVGGTAYVGTILLWKRRSSPAVSDRVLSLIASLEPFIVFSLTDAIARHRYVKPAGEVLKDSLGRIYAAARLTRAEQRVLTLQLLGLTNDEMAETLSVSLNTIRYHFKAIYKKTGTHSVSDLYTKYVIPWLDVQKAHE